MRGSGIVLEVPDGRQVERGPAGPGKDHRVPVYDCGHSCKTRTEHRSRAPIANALLAALPRGEYEHVLPDLEPVTLTFGEALYEPGDPIRQIYFPNDALVSLLTLVSCADHTRPALSPTFNDESSNADAYPVVIAY